MTPSASRSPYPFGYGLSYTTFEYKDAKVASNTLDSKGAPRVS